MVLPSTETAYPFLNFADDPVENIELISSLPKFEGIYDYESVKLTSEILLSSTVTGHKDKIPFMIRARAGLGNIIMIVHGKHQKQIFLDL